MNRKKLVLAALLAVAATPVLAIASPVPTLNEFQAGEPVLAADFNDNFDALSGAINDNDARISMLEAPPAPIVVRASNTISVPVQAASTTVRYNDVAEDSHDAYDPDTGVFTCPRPGLLQVSFNVFLQDLGDSNRLLVIEGPGHEYELERRRDAQPVTNLSSGLAIRCEAMGDAWSFQAACDEADGCNTRPQNGLRTYSNLSIVEVR